MQPFFVTISYSSVLHISWPGLLASGTYKAEIGKLNLLGIYTRISPLILFPQNPFIFHT